MHLPKRKKKTKKKTGITFIEIQSNKASQDTHLFGESSVSRHSNYGLNFFSRFAGCGSAVI